MLRRNLVLKGFLLKASSTVKYKNAIRHPLKVDLRLVGVRAIKLSIFCELRSARDGRSPLSLIFQKKAGVLRSCNSRSHLQRLAEIKVKRFLETDAEPIGVTQAALISLETGDILAYVGGKKYGYRTERGETSYDRVRAKTAGLNIQIVYLSGCP